MSTNEILYNIFWIGVYLIISGLVFYGLYSLTIGKKRKTAQQEHAYDLTFLQIKLPPENEVELASAEHLYSSLSGLKKSFFKSFFSGQYRISLEIVSKTEGIGFYVVVPDEIATLVEKQINGAYPEAEIDIVNPNEVWDRGKYTQVAELRLRGAPYFPIKNFEEAKTDPLNILTSAMSKMGTNEVVAVQLVIAPAQDTWSSAGRKYVNNVKVKLNNPEKKLNLDPSFLEGIEKKIVHAGFDTAIRIISIADTQSEAQVHINNLITSFGQFADPIHNKFVVKHSWKQNKANFKLTDDFIYRRLDTRSLSIPILDIILYKATSVLSTVELASLYHFPNKNVQTPNITWLRARRSAAPSNLPEEGSGIWIGESHFRGVRKQVFLKEKDRTRHFYIIGQTGTGKSELLKYMALQDIRNGEGVAVIDPHGSDVQDLLTKIPPERVDDVILFNVSDTTRPMGLNMLEAHSEEEKHVVINAFIALLYKLYDPNRQGIMGPQLERAIRNVMLTAMVDPSSTMVDVLRLLIDPKYAQKFIDKLTDPLVKRYWTDEIAKTSDYHKSEKMGYFVSKFDKFVTDKLMRDILGQPKSAFNLTDIMANKKIFLVDLAKGKIGEENSNFLGLLLVPRILTAALARHTLLEKGVDFPSFYLYVDEFQNFATPDFATILSEARKYKLNLTVAHQFVAQLSEEIKDAIFGNVGSMSVFRVGSDDAEFLEAYFNPPFTQKDLSSLPIGNAYVRLLIDGHPTQPFSMTMPWDVISTNVPQNEDIAAKIKENSRMKLGVPVEQVDEYINNRAGFNEPAEGPVMPRLPEMKVPF